MSTPKLAVVGRIASLSPIAGADRIELAVADCGEAGQWTGVVAIGLHSDDLVTVFLQDAVLPPDPRWAFMEKSRWRVRLARFKGVPSECVIVTGAPDVQPGTDLTEALGVTKYEKPVPVPDVAAVMELIESYATVCMINGPVEESLPVVVAAITALVQERDALKAIGVRALLNIYGDNWRDDLTDATNQVAAMGTQPAPAGDGGA